MEIEEYLDDYYEKKKRKKNTRKSIYTSSFLFLFYLYKLFFYFCFSLINQKKEKKKIWGVNSINHKDKGISLSPNHLVLFVHVKMFFTSQSGNPFSIL